MSFLPYYNYKAKPMSTRGNFIGKMENFQLQLNALIGQEKEFVSKRYKN
jgi:hypothetical protein